MPTAPLIRLAAMKADDLDPVWSRDNVKIVFTAMRDGNAEIYVMDANGSTKFGLQRTPPSTVSPTGK